MDESAATSGKPKLYRFLEDHPPGLAPLFFTELWERFSYYGMRALLVLYMVAAPESGGLGLSTAEAAAIYGNYTMAVYMLSIPGGFVADGFLGAHRSVVVGGAIIACGHFALAIPAEVSFYAGLTLIALGTGLFKPNISALVGALYESGDTRRDAGFSLFYMGINIGALAAPIVTGFLAQSALFKSMLSDWNMDPGASWHFGFAAAGVGMTLGLMHLLWRGGELRDLAPPPLQRPGPLGAVLVAAITLVLFALTVASDWEGFESLRLAFLALPAGAAVWLALTGDVVRRRMAAVFVLFIAAMIFFAIFEQAGVTIALFADQLTRNEAFGLAFPSAWFQSLNALFVILLAPLFAAIWLRLGVRQPSSPAKFAAGLGFLAASFLLMVPAAALTADGKVSPLWLVGLFLLQTIGELLLSPVGLSTMTKLAPVRLVGFVLGLWFLGAAWGNKLAGVFGSAFTATDPGALASYFLWQAALVAVAALVLASLTPWVKRLMGGVR